MSISGPNPLSLIGKVSFGGIVKEINLAYVPEVEIGNYVIVHVGFAISIINEEEAKRTLSYLNEISDLEKEFE